MSATLRAFLHRLDQVENWVWMALARAGAASSGPLPIVNTDLFIASTGNDANSGKSPTAPVRTYARIEQLYPALRTGALRVHFLDAGPFAIADGEHVLPPASNALTPPVQFLGHYAQNPAGGGAGVRTVLAVGTDTVQDTAGGLTPEFYGGAVLRRLTGNTWRRYFVTSHTANTFTLAFPWLNGGPPAPGDTFDVLLATSQLTYGNVTFNLNGSVLVCDGILWNANPIGGAVGWVWTNGTAYVPGGRVVLSAGRYGVEDGGLRTCDVIESTLVPTRYPTELPDLLGFFATTGPAIPGAGDVYAGPGGDLIAALTTQEPAPFGIDVVADAGGPIQLFDSDIQLVNELISQNGSGVQAGVSSPGNSHSHIRNLTHGASAAFGGFLKLAAVDMTGSATNAIEVQQGGVLVTSAVTGVTLAGVGITVDGGTLTDDGTSTVTGPVGDLQIDGQTMSWKQFKALGAVTPGVGPNSNFGGLKAPVFLLESLLWLRADFVTLAGGNVATLFDLSTHATNLTGLPGAQPLWEAAGFQAQASIKFDGVGEYLEGGITPLPALLSAAAQAQTTIIVVGEFHAVAGGGSRIYSMLPTAQAGDGAGQGQILYAPGALGAYTNPTGLEADIPQPAPGVPFIHMAVVDGTHVSAYRDGTKRSTTADTDLIIADQLWVGCGKSAGGAAFFAPYRLAELIILPGLLSVADLTQLDRYLGNRYSIAVT